MPLNSLLEEISGDISWRSLELKKTKLIHRKVNEQESKFILKATVPMIYAHWEGFIVTSMKLVFGYLNDQELNTNTCNINILTTAHEQNLKSLEDSQDFEKRKKHLTNLLEQLKKKIKFETKIDTKSNLNYKVLEDMCKKLNLNIDNFKTEKAFY